MFPEALPRSHEGSEKEGLRIQSRIWQSEAMNSLLTSRFLKVILAAACLTRAWALDTVVVVNEVQYNPPGPSELGEWIELHNQNGVDVDISGWKLTGGIAFTFAEGTIVPGNGYLLVARDPATLAQSGLTGSLGPWDGQLNNSGDVIRVRDNNDRLMDELSYGDKGPWPIAPDGSGATLAKKSNDGSSANPADWTFSAQSGGTPKAGNFPPPPPPVSSTPVARDATWRYLTTGVEPVGWKSLAFDDSAAPWQGGPGLFRFGNAQVWQPGGPLPVGGIVNQMPWVGDGATLQGQPIFSSTKTYTHKVAFHRATAVTAINGVLFDAGGLEVRTGANWTLKGASASFANNGANNLPAATGSRQLCENFFYGAADGGRSCLTLSGLTANTSYVVSFYTVGYGGPGIRFCNITPSDTGRPFLVDENAPNNGNGQIIRYRYKAPASGVVSFDFTPLVAGNTWHHYAFSNETTSSAPTEVEATGVTVDSFSSQLTSSPWSRLAAHTINGTGLSSGRHGTTPDGNMWLTNGSFAAPADPLPAEITYNLGAATNLTSLHIWNYNEVNLVSRGARTVEILTAPSPGGAFTSRGVYSLYAASGAATEPGQHIELMADGVQMVKLNITANHGDTLQWTGLSEVRFYKEGTTGQGPPTLFKESIAGIYNSGVDNAGVPLAPNTNDPHYINVATGSPVLAMSPNGAWVADDGVSRFIGGVGSGASNMAAGTFTYRTSANFSGYDVSQATVRFQIAADNSFDSLRLNGNLVAGLSGANFDTYYGPFTLPGPFNAGANTVDFVWSNAGTTPNPGGIRIKWNAVAPPLFYRTTLAANPVTSYFRKKFTLSGGANSSWSGRLQYVVDDGAVFYLNGVELTRYNVPSNATATTPATADVAFPMYSSYVQVPPQLLQTGENILAVELHQATGGAGDALLGATLDVTETPVTLTKQNINFDKLTAATSAEFQLDLRNGPNGPMNLTGFKIVGSAGQEAFLTGSLAAGQFMSINQATLGFRPLDGDKLFLQDAAGNTLDAVVVKNKNQARTASGELMTPVSYQAGVAASFDISDALVISEIMYHHHPTWLPTGRTENAEEWVEIYNKSAASVNLVGWKLRGGVEFDFTTEVIPAGERLVVAKNAVALLAKHPSLAGRIAGPWRGSLSNKSDTVVLEDANDNVTDRVTYHSGGRWPSAADGGGSSLELRDMLADNSLPESWVASDEQQKVSWQTYTWQGTGAPFAGTNDPSAYHEFIFGLLNTGECLVDDISVKEVNVGNRELIQNGNFSAGNAETWRLLGNHGFHGRSEVVDDPASPGNKVLKIVATSATEHMHNHVETTLKNGSTLVTLSNASTYQISFRARWLSGSPRLQARLYFNRLAAQQVLPMPVKPGTPGASNSRGVVNVGPGLSLLSHTPVVPTADLGVTVRVKAVDAQGIGSVQLHYRDGNGLATAPFTTVTMNMGADGHYEATVPSQAAGYLLEFYVAATDTLGAASRHPADNALIRWADAGSVVFPGHQIRILMTKAHTDFLHTPTNVMSNDYLPATVVYKEREVFYHARCRLKSSERGRPADVRLGFAVEFDPMQPFRGKMLGINLDRSSYGRGTTGSGYGQSELWNWHFFAKAGGIPSMQNDLVYLLSPRTAHQGSAMLTMAEFNDPYLDGQYNNGAAFPTFKYELIYWPTTTVSGPESLKLPSPDDVYPVNVGGISSVSKEAYRWNFLIQNARGDDDYSRIMNLNAVFRQTGAAYTAALPQAVDVQQWLRCFAAFSLAGIGDHYSSAASGWHNLKLYHRPDGRVLFVPWDPDFNSEPSNAALVRAPALSQMMAAKPEWHRSYYVHLHDIITKCFNTAYASRWCPHFQQYTTTGGDWNEITTYVTQRAAFALSQCNAAYPAGSFAVTTNDFTTAGHIATISGSAWINVASIRVAGAAESLPLTWPTGTTWQATLPLVQGANNFVIQGLDMNGNVVASDTIIITSTSGVQAADATNLVISELHYNPAEPTAAEQSFGFVNNEEFEFIELQNISPFIVDLTGVRLFGGIDWVAPSGRQLPPGGRVAIPRNASAFALRYLGVPALPAYFQANANFLANSGEEIALLDGTGIDIKRFSYQDTWPWPAADGSGHSLVLIAPLTNPDHNNPLNWRASRATNGTPTTSDALPLPINPQADTNGNGLSNLVDYAIGSIENLPTVTSSAEGLDLTVLRTAGSDANFVIQGSHTLTNPSWQNITTAELLVREPRPNDTEALIFRIPVPNGQEQRFFLRVDFAAPAP